MKNSKPECVKRKPAGEAAGQPTRAAPRSVGVLACWFPGRLALIPEDLLHRYARFSPPDARAPRHGFACFLGDPASPCGKEQKYALMRDAPAFMKWERLQDPQNNACLTTLRGIIKHPNENCGCTFALKCAKPADGMDEQLCDSRIQEVVMAPELVEWQSGNYNRAKRNDTF